MRIIIISIAMFFSLVSTALAEGGKDVAGHPLVDFRKGKQEPKAAAAVPSTGAIVVTGYQNLSSDGNDDVYTVKYAADGSVIWRASLDVSAGSDQGAAVVIDQSGDAIVAATVMNSGSYDIYVTRYHDNGTSTPTVVWSRTWSGTPGMADNVQTLAYDGAGDRVYVGGYSNNGSNDDYLLLAFDNNKSGDNPPLWAQKFDGSGKDRAYAVAVSADGATIALTGETFNGVDMDMSTVMWQNNGTRIGIWPKPGTTSYNDRGTAIAFTPSGNVAVTGYLTNGRGGDLYTAELTPASATPVWEAAHDAGFDDQPATVAVDSLGDIYVAATVGTLPAFSKLYAIKYHKNGTPIPDTLWSTTFDAGSAKTSGAVAMAVDTTGSLFISGWRDYSGVKKIVTMKISQKTGRLLWNREWSGVIGNSSMATSIGLADQEVITAAWTDRTQPLDGGTLAATAGSKTHLQNSDKVWSTNQWAGYSLYMVSSQNKDVFRRIQSNDSTTLYLAPAEALPYAVVPGDLYYIYDKDDIDLLVTRQEKGILDPPSGLSTEVLSNSSVRLTFQDNSETETRFSIDVKIGENGTWNNNAYTVDSLDQAGMNSVALELSGLLADTEYYFRVRAFADIADSGYSGEEVVALTRVVNFSSPTLTYSHADIAGGDDQATDVACYGGGALVVTGTVFSDQNGFSSPSKDYYTVKLHRNTFDIIWKDQRDGGYAQDDEIVALAVDPQLETVVTGTSMQNISGAGIIPSVWTLKYAFSPTLDGLGEAEPIWTNQLNGSGRLADQSDVVAVQRVSPYAIAVAGHGHADLNNISLFVRKLSASGTVQFTTEQDFGGNEYPVAAAVDALGNVLIAGHVEKTTGNSWIVAKFDAVSGAITWSDTYGDTGDNRALSLAVDANNDVYVTGYITDSATGYTRMTTIKYLGEAVGAADRIWTSIYPPELPGTSFAARKITYDTFANELIIAGDGYVYLTDRDLILLRYNTAGTLIKQVELRNPGSDEIVTGVAIDPSGYIYVSADSGASPNTNIIATIYTESLNYVKSFLYNGVANKNDHATAIAANKFGQGFIAGYTTSAAGNKDFLAFRIENDQTIMPFGALATPQADFSKVDISWSNVTSGTTPYIKRRNPDTGAWEPPPGTANGQLPVDAALFTDTLLDPNTPYCWRVYADSVTQRYAEACTTTTITSPVLSSYSNITTSSATVHWTNISGNIGYRLERKTDVAGTWQTITTLPANTILFDDPGLASGVTYYYRLSIQNAGGFSLPSAEFMVPTMPKTIVNGWYQNYSPSPTTIIVRSSGPPSPITSLRVERKTGASGTWSTVGSADATSFQFNDSSLTPNTTYYYRLFSVYKGIENPTPGPEVAVTTLTNPPTLLSATALSPLSVSGSWSPVTDSAGYVLNAKACFGTISQIKSNPNTQCNGYGTPTYTTSWAANVFEGTVNIDPLVRYAAYWVSASAKNSAGYPSLPGNSLVRFLPLSVTLTNVDISGSNQLRPTWTNTTEEYFDVQRRLSSATPPYSWTTVKAALPADTLSWTDTTVTNDTGYCYQIRAYAAAGDPADSVSNEVCQIAKAPPAPPALSLSTPSTTTVLFQWNNPNHPAPTNFDIYTSSYNYSTAVLPQPGNEYGWPLGTLRTTVSCTTDPCSHSYATSRGEGIKGFVRMSFNGTNIDSQTVSPIDGYVQTMPNPPGITSVSGTDSTATVSYGRILEAYSYNIYYKKAADSTWSSPLPAPFSGSPLPYTINGLDPGTQYHIKVESMGKTTESTDAIIKTVWTLCTAPTITNVSSVTANQATVSWSSSANATGYKLERSTDNVTWTVVTNQNVLSYQDSGLTAGGTYWYRVKAVNGGGDSVPSATFQIVAVPAAPEDPMPRQVSDSIMELSFKLVKGASSYKIFRRDGGPAAAQTYIKTAEVIYTEDYCGSAYPTIACSASKATTNTVTDMGLQPNTTYCYAMAASNANGDSAISQELCGQTSAMGAPILTVTPQNPFATTVSWTPGFAAVAIDGHVVEAIESDGTIKTLAQVPMPGLSFTDKSGLAPGAKRTYRVRPYRRFYDDFTAGLSLTNWAPWGRHRHGDGNEEFTTPPVDATDIDGTVRVSWDPSGKAELYTQVPGGIPINSYNFAQIGLNRLDLFSGDFDINYDFTVDTPSIIPDSMNAYNVYNRLRIYFPNSASGSLRNDVGFGYNNSTGGPYFDSYSWVRGVNTAVGPWYSGEKLQSSGIKASRRGQTMQYYRKAGTGWSPTTSNAQTSTMTPDYVWIVTFNNRTNPTPTEIRTLVDNVEVIGYGTASTPATALMPFFDGNKNYCP